MLDWVPDFIQVYFWDPEAERLIDKSMAFRDSARAFWSVMFFGPLVLILRAWYKKLKGKDEKQQEEIDELKEQETTDVGNMLARIEALEQKAI